MFVQGVSPMGFSMETFFFLLHMKNDKEGLTVHPSGIWKDSSVDVAAPWQCHKPPMTGNGLYQLLNL